MKKINNFVLVKAGLSLALVLPGFVLAEDYSLPQLQADTSRVESIMKPNGRVAPDNGLDAVDAILQNVKKKAELDKKETELRDKVRSWVKKNDGIDALETQMKVFEQKALKDRGVNLKEAQQLASRVSQTQSLANPADFNTSSLPQACKKGVDLQQFKSAMDTMQSSAGQKFSSKVNDLLSDKVKANEALEKQKLLALMAEFKDAANRDPIDEEKLVADAVKGARGTEARIKELETEKLPGLKNRNKEKRSELVDSLFKFITTISAVDKNDKDVNKAGNEFATNIENSIPQVTQMGLDAVDKLLSNCKSQKKATFVEIEKTRRGLMPIVGVEAANLDAQAQIARANKLQCNDVSSNVQAILSGAAGGNLKATLAQVRAEKNPIKMIAKAVEATQELAKNEALIGQQISPLMDECNDAAKGLEALKQRGQPVASSSQQRPGSGSVVRSSPSGSGSFWNASQPRNSTSHF